MPGKNYMKTAYCWVNRIFRCMGIVLLGLAGAGAAWAQAPQYWQAPGAEARMAEVRSAEVTARLLAWAPQGIALGRPMWLGVQLQHAPGWHTYWKNPGQAGMATHMQWQLPQDWSAGDVHWPAPERFTVGDLVNLGYDGNVLLAAPVQISAVPAHADTVTVALQARWLACRAECLPQQADLQLQLPLGQPLVEHAAVFVAAQQRVPALLPNPPGAQAATPAAVHARPRDGSRVSLQINGLPAAWQGELLNVYPEESDIFDLQAPVEQRWQGQTWHADLPLDAHRTASPDALALVVALPAQSAEQNGIQRNAPEQRAYRLQARVQGNWPAAAASSAESAASTALSASAVPATSTETAAEPAPMPQAGSANQAEPVAPAEVSSASGTLWGWWLSMASALLGGFLLNLMPCVFPVLGIKILGFAQHAHSARELRLSGVLCSTGCIVSFLLLAGGLLALRAGGSQLGWGFQLQNPYVVVALAVLFTVLALNFLGMFEVGQWVPQAWQGLGNNHGVKVQAFSSGVLSVLVASPCSAPFVGAALGFALNLPAWQALAVFACLGLGLALPVLLISFAPAMLRWLPKPGQWMLALREWMAFPMLITVIWLAWVLGQQRGVGSMAALLGMLVLLSGLLWACQLQGWARRLGVVFFALALLGMGALQGKELAAAPATTQAATQAAIAEGGWQPWSPNRVQAALQAGQPVLVNYTAAWCITCQFNQKNVFDQEAFAQLAHQNRVALLKADWTRSDPAITESLRSLGRAAVPTYAIYHPGAGGKPQILTELLTLEQIRQALQKP